MGKNQVQFYGNTGLVNCWFASMCWLFEFWKGKGYFVFVFFWVLLVTQLFIIRSLFFFYMRSLIECHSELVGCWYRNIIMYSSSRNDVIAFYKEGYLWNICRNIIYNQPYKIYTEWINKNSTFVYDLWTAHPEFSILYSLLIST